MTSTIQWRDEDLPEIERSLFALKLWLQGGLDKLQGRVTCHGSAIINSYAVAEFPDWDVRQKIEIIDGLIASLPGHPNSGQEAR